MKRTVKTLVRLLISIPVIARNVFYEYWYKPVIADGDQVLADLSVEGYHVFDDRILLDEVERLVGDFAALKELNSVAEDGQSAGRIHCHGAISDLAEIYVDRFRGIAENYFASSDIRCELTMYQHSWVKSSRSDVPGGDFHVDDNKRNLKFFVYLTDVDIDNGPFCYVPQTHGFRGVTTLVRWWAWEVFRSRRFLYEFMINEEVLEKKMEPILGQAGSCFCADTTGIHKAMSLRDGERKVFVVSFTRNLLQI